MHAFQYVRRRIVGELVLRGGYVNGGGCSATEEGRGDSTRLYGCVGHQAARQRRFFMAETVWEGVIHLDGGTRH